MIRTEQEYQATVKKLQSAKSHNEKFKKSLLDKGNSKQEIERAIEPMLSFDAQLKDEIECYERLKRGDFGELHNFQGMGQLLVALRIYSGISQRELANRLKVHESQVSRDERNEYHGATLERANRILDALRVDIVSKVNINNPQQDEELVCT